MNHEWYCFEKILGGNHDTLVEVSGKNDWQCVGRRNTHTRSIPARSNRYHLFCEARYAYDPWTLSITFLHSSSPLFRGAVIESFMFELLSALEHELYSTFLRKLVSSIDHTSKSCWWGQSVCWHTLYENGTLQITNQLVAVCSWIVFWNTISAIRQWCHWIWHH